MTALDAPMFSREIVACSGVMLYGNAPSVRSAASFDMFDNFAARGSAFAAAVRELMPA